MIRLIKNFDDRLHEYEMNEKEYAFLHKFIIDNLIKLYDVSKINYLNPYFTMDKLFLIFDLMFSIGPYNYPVKPKRLLFLGACSEVYLIKNPTRIDYRETARIIIERYNYDFDIIMEPLELKMFMNNIGMIDKYGILGSIRNGIFEEQFIHDLDIIHFYKDINKSIDLFCKDFCNHLKLDVNSELARYMAMNVLRRRYGEAGSRKIILPELRTNQAIMEMVERGKRLLK